MAQFSSGCIAGTLVLDASRVLAGPFAGQLLGDHGADVIKVESFDGDDTRGYGPPFVEGTAPYFMGLNRNKRDLALDLSGPDGIGLLFEMLEHVDVFIENFKLSTWKKWGVDDLSELTRRFPRLVHCRVSGFGETGQYGGLPGYDAALQAMSGLMAVNGPLDIDACRIGIPIVDTCTGMYGCIGILLALLERNRSGRGQQVEVTLYDTALAMLHPHVSNVLYGGKASRTGNGHPNIVPYDLFPTATVPLFLAVGNDRQFRTLCTELGMAAFGADLRYRTNGDRVVNRDSLRAALLPVLSNEDGMVLFKRLMQLGVPCAPVLSVDEALALDHTATREMVAELDGYRGAGVSVKLDRTPGSVRLPPPDIGEHSREVLMRFGLDADRIDRLVDASIVK